MDKHLFILVLFILRAKILETNLKTMFLFQNLHGTVIQHLKLRQMRILKLSIRVITSLKKK